MGDSPIIPNTGDSKMGRVRAGTEIAVREMTDEELGHHTRQTLDLYTDTDPEKWPSMLALTRWVVCFAADPTKVLFDWFSPVGGINEEYARKAADKYVRGRGAVLVDLGEPAPEEFCCARRADVVGGFEIDARGTFEEMIEHADIHDPCYTLGLVVIETSVVVRARERAIGVANG